MTKKLTRLSAVAIALLVGAAPIYSQTEIFGWKGCDMKQYQSGGCVNNPRTCNGDDCTMYTYTAGTTCIDAWIPSSCSVTTRSVSATMRTGNCTLSSMGCGCSGSDTNVTISVTSC